MDADPPVTPSGSSKKGSSRKLKFNPKAPPRSSKGPVLPTNDGKDDDAKATPDSRRTVNEGTGTRGTKVAKKSSDSAAISPVAGSSSTGVKTRSQVKDENSKNSSNLKVTDEKTTTKHEKSDAMSVDEEIDTSSDDETVYKEPWNLNSNPPISLPLRRPGSGNPELLNKKEFGEEKEYDENKINSAEELGLFEDNNEPKFIHFQFPIKLPLPAGTSTKGKEKENASNKCIDFTDLPTGFMGKMVVYKSGKIKFKLGDSIFDVSAGIHAEHFQHAAMMNTKSKVCCSIGEVNLKADVIPDAESMLDAILNS